MAIVYNLVPNIDGTQRTNYPAGDFVSEFNLPAPVITGIDNITHNSMRVNWSYPTTGTDADGFVLQRWITGVSTSWTSNPATNPTPSLAVRSSTEMGLPVNTLI